VGGRGRPPTEIREGEGLKLEPKANAGVAALVLLALVGLATCRTPLPAAERRWREGRQQAIGAALAEAGKPATGALRFYSFDPDYRVRTMVEPVTPPEPLRLPTSSGEIRPAHRIGRVRLRLPGGDAALSLFVLDDLQGSLPDHLFLPFRDAGAGVETYGAGRYVEIARQPGGVVEIDFNRAYNPDCAYGITAQCPITPAENTLPFAVEAGEMMPERH
jgi:uncharacterized protein